MQKSWLRRLRRLRPPAKWLIPGILLSCILLAGHENRADTGSRKRETASHGQGLDSRHRSANAKHAHNSTAEPPQMVTALKRTSDDITPLPESVVPPAAASAPKTKYLAGEDPEYARRHGWPVVHPEPLNGSLLAEKRIVAYYGNPLSKRMGVLGQYPKDEMLRRLKVEVERWEQADPGHIVIPALHLIAVVAQLDPGKAGKYRMILPDTIVNEVYAWAKEAQGILFIDIQAGHDDIRHLLPRFEWILKNPDVHLAVDPEFNLVHSRKSPGSRIGMMNADEINAAAAYLKNLVKRYNLPPKVFVIHRFTRGMVTNADKIELCPEVEIVMNMDGWGAPWLKRDSYRDYIVREPVQYTGFKIFYHNDTKNGHPLLRPADLLRLNPEPVYIQYQ